MNAADRIRLQHMLSAALEALVFAEGRTRGDLGEDRMLLLSLVKEIEIIGEAASKVSRETRNDVDEIPWSNVIAMRNRLTHAYFEWNLDAIWSTLVHNLHELVPQLERALSAKD